MYHLSSGNKRRRDQNVMHAMQSGNSWQCNSTWLLELHGWNVHRQHRPVLLQCMLSREHLVCLWGEHMHSLPSRLRICIGCQRVPDMPCRVLCKHYRDRHMLHVRPRKVPEPESSISLQDLRRWYIHQRAWYIRVRTLHTGIYCCQRRDQPVHSLRSWNEGAIFDPCGGRQCWFITAGIHVSV